MINYQSAQQ